MGTEWYYRSMGRTIGPLAAGQLRIAVAHGRIGPDTPVRKGASGKWVLARHVRGMFPEPPAAAGSGKSDKASEVSEEAVLDWIGRPTNSAQHGGETSVPLPPPSPGGEEGSSDDLHFPDWRPAGNRRAERPMCADSGTAQGRPSASPPRSRTRRPNWSNRAGLGVVIALLCLWALCSFTQETNRTDRRATDDYVSSQQPSWNPEMVNERLPPIEQRSRHIPESRQREVFRTICRIWADLEKTPRYQRADMGERSIMEDAALERWVSTQPDITLQDASDIWAKGGYLNWDIGDLQSRY